MDLVLDGPIPGFKRGGGDGGVRYFLVDGGAPGAPAPTIILTDGTALLPSFAFASEPTLGFWRSGAATVTLQGGLKITSLLQTASGAFGFAVGGLSYFGSGAQGILTLQRVDGAAGSQLKVDALPTVASGFGGSPAVIAGSTPFAGAVNVGTGGVATSGVINFNGTAFPSAPFCLAGASTTLIVVSATATTTQLTLSSTTPWAANDIIKWICVSSK
jgi:hypothetical protein